MTTLLVLIAIVLVLFVMGQVMRVFELSANLRGKAIYQVTEKEGKTQAVLMLVFLVSYFIFIIWQINKWGQYMLPVSASEHGVVTDNLFNISWIILIPTFVITHILLFYFAYKYVYNKNRRADFFAHSNKLELIWTVVPTVVLTILILYGLNTWNNVMSPVSEDVDHLKIELYAKQFDWTARYSGPDNKLGKANVHFIEGTNLVGLDARDPNAQDDIIVKGEFHLPVGIPVQFTMRSQDVIHSAFMPNFRAQMNCVPGITTHFKFTPTITTAEMREITGNPEYEYLLMCNKICGAAHYNMQMTIVVESLEDFLKWTAEQPGVTFENQTAVVETEAVVDEAAVVETVEATSEVIEADISEN